LMARADPYVVYYRDGHLRRSVLPFSDDYEAHITNAPGNDERKKEQTVSYYEATWSMVDLQKWIDINYEADTGKKAPPHYVRDVLRPYLKQVLRFTFLTGTFSGSDVAPDWRAQLGYHPETLNRTYYGGSVNQWALDFAMDDDLNVFLLEGNNEPVQAHYTSNAAGTFNDTAYHSAALELIARLQTEEWPRASPPLAHRGWELVHNEAAEACEEKEYDACGIFKGKSQREVAAQWPYAAPDWPPPGAPFKVNGPGANGAPYYGPQDQVALRERGITTPSGA